MTPERKSEIRAQLDKVAEYRTGNVEEYAVELLAEVDRLEAVVTGTVADLRREARVCSEAKWISEHATAGCGGNPAVFAARAELATATADALAQALSSPLDSPPAKR